jgi:hypothetical protein
MSRLVFIDGPNGIGKDYFINNFTELLKENGKSFIIKSVKNYMPKDNQLINTRQFSKKFFKESYFNTDVSNAHRKCIQDVIEIADSGEYDFIIINRSVLSYYVYNITVPRDILKLHKEYQDFIDKISKEQLRIANSNLMYIENILYNTIHRSYLIVLVPDIDMTYESVITRMESSRGVKYTDYEHMVLMTIFNSYMSYIETGLKHFYYFDHTEVLTSSLSQIAYQRLAEN